MTTTRCLMASAPNPKPQNKTAKEDECYEEPSQAKLPFSSLRGGFARTSVPNDRLPTVQCRKDIWSLLFRVAAVKSETPPLL